MADWLAAAGVPFAFLVSDTSALPHDHAHRPQISKPWSAAALLDTVDLMVAGRLRRRAAALDVVAAPPAAALGTADMLQPRSGGSTGPPR